jgi:signal transduction histidine kinase
LAEILYILQDHEDQGAVRRLRRCLNHAVAALPAEEDLDQAKADLALVDIGAAEGAVFDIVRRLSKAGIPVVAWSRESGNEAVSVRRQALALGCVGYVPKPLPADAAVRIESYVEGHRDDPIDRESRGAAVQVLGRAAVSRLAQANGALRQRLEQRDLWFHSTVHELRSAAAWVAVYASMIEQGREVAGELTVWDHFRAGLAALARRIADLECFSQGETGELPLDLELHDLAGLAEDYVERHQLVCRECALRTALDPVIIEADRGRLTQVLDNLVDNAHKFTTMAGRDPEIEVRVRQSGEWAFLEVLDNGPGVPSNEREVLFRPFARAETHKSRAAPGMGLGLSVVQTIAQAHGGAVWCTDSPRGPGSRFRVCLPLRGPSRSQAREGDDGDASSRVLAVAESDAAEKA